MKAAIVSLLLGCMVASVSAQPAAKASSPDPMRDRAIELIAGPSAGAPRLNATSFAPALRCMDDMFKNFGARGTSVVLEDIPDATTKVKVGAKDMFMSATSQMTRSSRAVRLIPWDKGAIYSGRDDVLKNAGFAVQGSISQFDETMLRKQRDGAICLGPLCIGAAESDTLSGMSLDLNVVETDGLTLLPGVTSKNYVLVRRKGRGADGDLSLKKFGVQYNFTFNSSDGQGQALRSLVELSVIELYGRLLKIPYWTCLGLSDAEPGVAMEIEDWWETLRGDPRALVIYLKAQMKLRDLYAGEVNEQVDDALFRAVRAYKVSLGGSDDLTLDMPFFKAYLAADHAKVKVAAAARLAEIQAREGPPALPVAAAARPTFRLESAKGPQGRYAPGEAVAFQVEVARESHLYCYLIDDQKRATQFFPNPARPSARVAAGETIAFPGAFGFRIVASRRALPETIACFAAPTDLGAEALPRPIGAGDVNALRLLLTQRLGRDPELGVIDVETQ